MTEILNTLNIHRLESIDHLEVTRQSKKVFDALNNAIKSEHRVAVIYLALGEKFHKDVITKLTQLGISYRQDEKETKYICD